VLTSYFGNDLPVEGWSEAFGPATLRSWPNFSEAADEANLARIWGGIHFRTALVDARTAGDAIGAYVMANATQPPNRLQMLRIGSASLKLVFLGKPGTVWNLQRATGVTGPWTNIGVFLIDSTGVGEFLETNPPPGAAFYRGLKQ
jgi:hypothetical protein